MTDPSAGIALLDSEIADQVNEHYEDLLSQASGTDTLDEVLQTMLARIQVSTAPSDTHGSAPSDTHTD